MKLTGIVIFLCVLIFLHLYFRNGTLSFSNKMVNKTAQSIIKVHGNPNKIEINTKDKSINKMIWNNIDGCDGVIVKGDVKYKWHPIPAVTYVFAYKYMPVPEKLQGALSYASETILVDYIDIPKEHSRNFYENGTKLMAKVSGACASITISIITIKFVEDMVVKYGNTQYDSEYLSQIFRKEYDNRILNYLCGKGIVPSIPWYPNKVEAKYIDGPFKGGKLPNQCMSI